MEFDKENIVKEKGELIYQLIGEVVNEVGPRLPTSEAEERGCDKVAEQMKRELNANPIKEEFITAPRASIAAIPLLGLGGAIQVGLFFVTPIASLVLGILLFTFAFLQVFSYSGILDKLFKQGKSHNVYSVLEPKKEAKYTILMSGHIDTSWCWKLSYKNPNTAILKTAIGVISILAMTVLSVVALAKGAITYEYMLTAFTIVDKPSARQIMDMIMYCVPFLALPGCYWLFNYLTHDPKMASPGAMDNMSGIAIGEAVAKYLQENPDKWPEDCRIMVAAMGCEEAGLKGSMAFCKAHKNDTDWFNDSLYNINLDSFRDDNYFNAVKGDIWLGTHFSKDMIDMSMEAMNEAGVNPSIISNPVGGCDSTPFCRAGIKTVTLNAQKPTTTNYYHTPNDNMEGLSMYSLEKGFETVINLLPKIDKYERERQQK